MSQDTSSKPNNMHDIDLDDLEVEILIIAKNANGMNQAANFLSRRGWPTRVLSNVGKAIEVISDKQPDIILVSFNHTHPAVLKLPDLITRTFNLTVVGFAEVLDSVTTARLNNFRMQHKLQGQPSGPSIQRAIRKILAEKFNFKGADESESNDASSNKDQNEMIQGGAPAAKSGSSLIYQKGNAGVEGRGTSGHAESSDALAESEVVSSGKYTMKNKKARLSLKKATGMEEIAKAAALDASLIFSQALAQESGIYNDSDDGGQTTIAKAGTEGTRAENQGTEAAHGLNETIALEMAVSEATASGGLKSLMQSTVEVALDSVCTREAGTIPLAHIERVCVFPLDSDTEPGYLVVAWNGQEANNQFLNACEAALKKAFSENGVSAKVESGFWVSVPDVKYWKWVNSKAQFFFALSHQGQQVGASFFASATPLPKARELEETGMYSIGLDHIATDQPVPFKAYLHMRKNKKHFLYLRDGRQLQPEQKKRLKTNQVNDLSLKSIDVENLRMFLAASYLRATIKGADDDAA